MGAQHRHADAGDADGDLIVLEDFPGLLDHLGLFVVVAGLGIDRRVVAEDVEGVRKRDHLGRERLAVEIGAGRFHQLLHRRRAGAARRLIGRQDHALDAVLPVDRPQRHQRRDRRAVRIGDDALVSRMRLALISGITSGTSGSMRKAEELSTTTAPAFTAAGANFARCRRRPRTTRCRRPRRLLRELLDHDPWPRKSTVLPAERAWPAPELADGKGAPVHGGDELDRGGGAVTPSNRSARGRRSRVYPLSSPRRRLQAIKKPRSFFTGLG